MTEPVATSVFIVDSLRALEGTVNLLKLSGGTGMAGSGGSVCGARVRPPWLCR
jgi:hypothetical protein